jgi:hypothetical protein
MSPHSLAIFNALSTIPRSAASSHDPQPPDFRLLHRLRRLASCRCSCLPTHNPVFFSAMECKGWCWQAWIPSGRSRPFLPPGSTGPFRVDQPAVPPRSTFDVSTLSANNPARDYIKDGVLAGRVRIHVNPAQGSYRTGIISRAKAAAGRDETLTLQKFKEPSTG